MLNQQLQDKFLNLLGVEWYNAMKGYLDTDDFSRLTLELFKERRKYTIYPEKGSDLLFKAFRTTPPSKVKVVILGQDPYHDGSYDGFAFSNREKLRLSPSLLNIFKEVETDIFNGLNLNPDPSLERWAKQGVLLINTAHTVRKGEPTSHLHLWDIFTARVIHILINKYKPVVWILWGVKAKRHLELKVLPKNQLKLVAAHPSPFSAANGFFGCKHFSKTNEFLLNHNIEPIIW